MPVFSSGLEEKKTFAKDDMLLIGDSEANDTTRKIKVGTLLAGAGAGGGAPKHKTGDVVYITSKNNYGTLRIIDWDTYKSNPSNYEAIGLVVDPVKRTFLFCDLSTYKFSTTAGREKLGKYSSFDDGMETHKRVRGIRDSSLQDYFPVFYHLTNHGGSWSGIFYPRCKDVNGYFVPSLNEWTPARDELCSAFYDDENNYGSAMDRLIAAKTGVSVGSGLFLKNVEVVNGGNFGSVPSIFYSQLSTMGMTAGGENTYNMNGEVIGWTDDNNIATPVFGIYTEEEENA